MVDALQTVIVTGLSGSGKSIVMKALEDNGYYCVDNLPAQMLDEVIRYLSAAGQKLIAISVDSRSAKLEELPRHIRDLKKQGQDIHLLFLESNIETLVKRYSETRRRHPLSDEGRTLAESIVLEREMMEELANLGHRIDTSELSANTLRSWVRDFIELDHNGLALLFESFGFKHGSPLDADYVFDVRCLPNPHYDQLLRPLTGKDQPVIQFLERQAVVLDMLGDIKGYIEKWLPCFVSDNRSYLTVAIGCTGGQHRSVFLVEQLAGHFRALGQRVLVRHRELE